MVVDFWATWCGPCVAELPNVVGITLENPNAKPKDTPEQTAAKLQTAKSKLLDFAAKHEMPWPQVFDGKGWKNDSAAKYGINSMPAMVVFDQDGKIVSAEARGERLEHEITRRLKL